MAQPVTSENIYSKTDLYTTRSLEALRVFDDEWLLVIPKDVRSAEVESERTIWTPLIRAGRAFLEGRMALVKGFEGSSDVLEIPAISGTDAIIRRGFVIRAEFTQRVAAMRSQITTIDEDTMDIHDEKIRQNAWEGWNTKNGDKTEYHKGIYDHMLIQIMTRINRRLTEEEMADLRAELPLHHADMGTFIAAQLPVLRPIPRVGEDYDIAEREIGSQVQTLLQVAEASTYASEVLNLQALEILLRSNLFPSHTNALYREELDGLVNMLKARNANSVAQTDRDVLWERMEELLSDMDEYHDFDGANFDTAVALVICGAHSSLTRSGFSIYDIYRAGLPNNYHGRKSTWSERLVRATRAANPGIVTYTHTYYAETASTEFFGDYIEFTIIEGIVRITSAEKEIRSKKRLMRMKRPHFGKQRINISEVSPEQLRKDLGSE